MPANVSYPEHSGYKARVLRIPRHHNWYHKVSPNTKDAILWWTGWDQADRDLPNHECNEVMSEWYSDLFNYEKVLNLQVEVEHPSS